MTGGPAGGFPFVWGGGQRLGTWRCWWRRRALSDGPSGEFRGERGGDPWLLPGPWLRRRRESPHRDQTSESHSARHVTSLSLPPPRRVFASRPAPSVQPPPSVPKQPRRARRRRPRASHARSISSTTLIVFRMDLHLVPARPAVLVPVSLSFAPALQRKIRPASSMFRVTPS